MELSSDVGAQLGIGLGVGKRRTTNAHDAVGAIMLLAAQAAQTADLRTYFLSRSVVLLFSVSLSGLEARTVSISCPTLRVLVRILFTMEPERRRRRPTT